MRYAERIISDLEAEEVKIKGLIFDLDGVLVFTDKFHYQAWKTMADELGVYFDETINHRLRGVSRMDSLEIILERYEGPDLSLREKEKLAEKKNENLQDVTRVNDTRRCDKRSKRYIDKTSRKRI